LIGPGAGGGGRTDERSGMIGLSAYQHINGQVPTIPTNHGAACRRWSLRDSTTHRHVPEHHVRANDVHLRPRHIRLCNRRITRSKVIQARKTALSGRRNQQEKTIRTQKRNRGLRKRWRLQPRHQMGGLGIYSDSFEIAECRRKLES
jgi:hypothetical protein